MILQSLGKNTMTANWAETGMNGMPFRNELRSIYLCWAFFYNENPDTAFERGIQVQIIMSQKAQVFFHPELSDSSDQKLVTMALDGRDEAFEVLVLRYRRKITSTARRFFPSDDAEDLAQESFVRAYQNLHKLKPDVPFQRWLIRLTINTCLDRLRKEKRNPAEPVSQICPEDPNWLERQLGNRSQEEFRKFENKVEAESLLARILPRIDPKDQAVLHLIYGEGMNTDEAASVLGWSASNVRVRAFRAKRAMRKALETLLNVPQGED